MMAARPQSAPLASWLNDACQCIQIDRAKLDLGLRRQLGSLADAVPPGLVSGSVVFIDPNQASAMDRAIALITRAITSPAFEQVIAAAAPQIARQPQPTLGGVLGFDFHLGGPEPQLIEINTNPGGLLIGLELARAAEASCDCLTAPLAVMAGTNVPLGDVTERVTRGFLDEWTRARGSRPLRTIAIVDDDPQGQYLFPEFVLYRHLLEHAGYRVRVVDAAALAADGDTLCADGEAIDLVYNRCTDFYLAEARHAALRAAYERDLAVITPHPAAHARWADKRLLALLRDEALLEQAGLTADERTHLLLTIPATEIVDSARAADIWARRKDLFFKPVDGFGSKAAYRGDKLTRSTFEHVLAQRYVAQALAPTSFRRVPVAGSDDTPLRVDIRNFAMAGETWLRAARLYRGQTTNFRTAGGGFAPVLALPRSNAQVFAESAPAL